MTTLEPNGGNLYEAHPLQIDPGTFWRCKHGRTGFREGMVWKGCQYCRRTNPEKAKEWESELQKEFQQSKQ